MLSLHEWLPVTLFYVSCGLLAFVLIATVHYGNKEDDE
jgi:hypothetical protein